MTFGKFDLKAKENTVEKKIFPVMRKAKYIEYIIVITGFTLLGLFYCFLPDQLVSIGGIIFCLVFIGYGVILLVGGQCSHKFEIYQDGVRYVKRNTIYEMKWDDIEIIGVAANKHGVKNKYSMIYFKKRGYIPYDVSSYMNTIL